MPGSGQDYSTVATLARVDYAPRASAGTTRAPSVAFVMEQALGHVTYTRNLQAAYAYNPPLAPTWIPVPFPATGLLGRLPLARSNWTVRGSLRAHAALRAAGGPAQFDAVVYHTQTVALLAPLVSSRVPVVISLDATPINFDAVGAYYQHSAREGSRAERIKRGLHRRIYQGAAALTTWSAWARDSLRDDYGVDPARVTVIPPGVDLRLFGFGAEPRPRSAAAPVRLLFVGGDFARKGGPLLLEWLRGSEHVDCELHVVTSAPVPPTPRVFVHAGLGPNDPRLLELYATADIFVLPTHADCLAVVLGEAMAAGLPIVTTNVAAQPEAVTHGDNGYVVPSGDVRALGSAIQRLVEDPALRAAMGRRGRAIAEERFDACRNAARLADVVLAGIDNWKGRRRRS